MRAGAIKPVLPICVMPLLPAEADWPVSPTAQVPPLPGDEGKATVRLSPNGRVPSLIAELREQCSIRNQLLQAELRLGNQIGAIGRRYRDHLVTGPPPPRVPHAAALPLSHA